MSRRRQSPGVVLRDERTRALFAEFQAEAGGVAIGLDVLGAAVEGARAVEVAADRNERRAALRARQCFERALAAAWMPGSLVVPPPDSQSALLAGGLREGFALVGPEVAMLVGAYLPPQDGWLGALLGPECAT